MSSLFRVRVWDLPTRVFHWSLAVCVIGLVITGLRGSMNIHFLLGYVLLALLLFRLMWGVVGGQWSRFSSFLYSPASLWRYLRGAGPPAWSVGHTPTGALAVFGMLFVLLAQVATGLVSDDEIASAGPFAALFSSAVVRGATWYHAGAGKIIVWVLVALHLLAIAYYRFRKGVRLVGPMLTGDKWLQEDAPSSRDDVWSRLGAALLLCLAGVLVAVLLWFAPGG